MPWVYRTDLPPRQNVNLLGQRIHANVSKHHHAVGDQWVSIYTKVSLNGAVMQIARSHPRPNSAAAHDEAAWEAIRHLSTSPEAISSIASRSSLNITYAIIPMNGMWRCTWYHNQTIIGQIDGQTQEIAYEASAIPAMAWLIDAGQQI